ncbi:hypothetical protein B0H19DRAFT_956560 [Mycena capillaripes]|nr:hypothetical protein B0H19DRAFT_956560 [Mycena capillaripes]
MTCYKAQGRTLESAVINLADCHGTEGPYVMISRVTSLEGLAILTPFDKAKICCRPSEDLRRESRRLEILALKTIISYGTENERTTAAAKLQNEFRVDVDKECDSASTEDENSVPEDPAIRLKRLQKQNFQLTAPAPVQVR